MAWPAARHPTLVDSNSTRAESFVVIHLDPGAASRADVSKHANHNALGWIICPGRALRTGPKSWCRRFNPVPAHHFSQLLALQRGFFELSLCPGLCPTRDAGGSQAARVDLDAGLVGLIEHRDAQDRNGCTQRKDGAAAKCARAGRFAAGSAAGTMPAICQATWSPARLADTQQDGR